MHGCSTFLDGNALSPGPRQWISPDIRTERPGWGGMVFPAFVEHVELTLDESVVGVRRLVMSGLESCIYFNEGLAVNGSSRVTPQPFHHLGGFPGHPLISTWTFAPGAGSWQEYSARGQEVRGTGNSS
jgi:hypothetical protein